MKYVINNSNSIASKLRIALVIEDTLTRLGLESVIYTLAERTLLDSYESFDAFVASNDDLYDVAFVSPESLLINEEYFRARRTRVIPVIWSGDAEELWNNKEASYLHSRWNIDQLQQKLSDLISENQKAKQSATDKGLSLREEEVLKEVARGLTNKEIADELNISMNTVMTHRKNITAKLNIKTVPGLTFYALMNGLVSGEEVVDHASDK